jgi:hypothetical protein
MERRLRGWFVIIACKPSTRFADTAGALKPVKLASDTGAYDPPILRHPNGQATAYHSGRTSAAASSATGPRRSVGTASPSPFAESLRLAKDAPHPISSNSRTLQLGERLWEDYRAFAQRDYHCLMIGNCNMAIVATSLLIRRLVSIDGVSRTSG